MLYGFSAGVRVVLVRCLFLLACKAEKKNLIRNAEREREREREREIEHQTVGIKRHSVQ